MERSYWLEMAEKLEAASREGRTCRLTPTTALRLATAARSMAKAPTRDEVALAYCLQKRNEKCKVPCITCLGKANTAVAVYTGRRRD